MDRSYRLASAILGDQTEAQDAVQDAWVQAWLHAPSLRDDTRFEAWFTRILVNTCRNRLRGGARRRVVDISEQLDLADTADDIAGVHRRDQLRRALQQLSPDHRVVVGLRFQLDLSVDEIAARLGMPAGTVKSRLHHALRRLELAVNDDVREGGAP